jgi:hypothetical protein
VTDFLVLKFCNVHFYKCHILSFFHTPEYQVFRVDILHVSRTQHCPYLDIIYFFETLKCSLDYLEEALDVTRHIFAVPAQTKGHSSGFLIRNLVISILWSKEILRENLLWIEILQNCYEIPSIQRDTKPYLLMVNMLDDSSHHTPFFCIMRRSRCNRLIRLTNRIYLNECRFCLPNTSEKWKLHVSKKEQNSDLGNNVSHKHAKYHF